MGIKVRLKRQFKQNVNSLEKCKEVQHKTFTADIFLGGLIGEIFIKIKLIN